MSLEDCQITLFNFDNVKIKIVKNVCIASMFDILL